MHTLKWVNELQGGTIEDGVAYIDQFYWHIEVVEGRDFWGVYAGDCLIYQASSRELVDAFLYGLCLPLNVLPPHIAKMLRREIQKEIGEPIDD